MAAATAGRRRSNVLAWRMREAHRALAQSKNQQKCGLVRIQEDVEVWTHGETGRAYYSGLVSCGSWSACPVCSRRIGTRKGDEIADAIRRHQSAGGDVWMMTLTIAHSAGDSLRAQHRAVSELWSWCQSGAAWAGGRRVRGWKARLGIVGAIRAFDCTHGPSGWHPHLHILLLLDRRPRTIEERRERWREALAFRRWISRKWGDGVEGRLGESCRPSVRRGVRIQRGNNAGWYVAKMGLGRELSGIWTKRGRTGHRTPWQILRDFSRARPRSAERARDRALWVEWVEAMHGQQQVSWSKGLRARLGVGEEPPDDVLAATPAALDRLVYTIPAYLWGRLASIALAPAALLDAADDGGVPALERQIQRLSPVLGYREHHRLAELQDAQDRITNHRRFVTIGAEDRRRRIAEGRRSPNGVRCDGAWLPVTGSVMPPGWYRLRGPGDRLADVVASRS